MTSHQAALRLKPSLTLLCSFIYLALRTLGTGIPCYLLVKWGADGSYPFFSNAYKELSTKHQERLQLIQPFFIEDGLPRVEDIEHTADLICIVCGLERARELEDETFAKYQRNNFRGLGEELRKRLIGGEETLGTITNDTKPIGTQSMWTSLRTIGQDAPLMALRIIADLGLQQRVLDLTLALMGVPFQHPTPSDNPVDSWFPKPLRCAASDRLLSTMHVVSVIVVACKMTKGWENWVVRLMMKNTKKSHKFIPFNEDQFKLLGNGPMLHGYLDYLEDTYGQEMPIHRNYNTVMTEIDNVLTPEKNQHYSEEHYSDSDVSHRTIESLSHTVKPNLILAGSPNPRHQQLLRCRKGAVANGLDEYVIYDDFKTHAATKTEDGRDTHSSLTPQPFHPHYGLLIEYVCYKTGMEPRELHYLVACIDEEIAQYQ